MMDRNQLLYRALQIKEENYKQSCLVLSFAHNHPKMINTPINLPLEDSFREDDIEISKLGYQETHKIRLVRQHFDPIVNDWQEAYVEFQSKQAFDAFFDDDFLKTLLELPAESRFENIKEKFQQTNDFFNAQTIINQWLRRFNYHLKKQEYEVSFIYDNDTIEPYNLQDIATYTEKNEYFSDYLFLGDTRCASDDWVTRAEFDAISEEFEASDEVCYFMEIDNRVKSAGYLQSSADETWHALRGEDEDLISDLYTIYDEQENEVLSMVNQKQLFNFICFQFLNSQNKLSDFMPPCIEEIPMSLYHTNAIIVYLNEYMAKTEIETENEEETLFLGTSARHEYLLYNGHYLATNDIIEWNTTARFQLQSSFKFLPPDACLKMLFEWLMQQGYHIAWTADSEHTWSNIYNYEPLQVRQSYHHAIASSQSDDIPVSTYYTIDDAQGNRILSHVSKEEVFEALLSKVNLFE